jgi:hypothetical protein
MEEIMDRTIETYDLFASEVLAAGGSAISSPVDLRERAKNGNLSLEYVITATGSPTVDINYALSYDAVNWVSGTTELADGLTKASGTSGRGIVDISSDIELAPWIRFIINEDASDASGVTVSLKLATQ